MSSRNKLMPNYGWVQNTSNLSTVRDTIDLVPEYGIEHMDLMDRIKQFRLDKDDFPQKGRWTWDARCRLKAICACGLVTLDRNIQGYVLTSYGKQLQMAEKSNIFYRNKRILSEEEKTIFRDGLLTNPPVIRVLELLVQERRERNFGLSKYDVGAKLGFVGDVGFTHYNPEWIVANNYNFNTKEGDSDKWARTILSWLMQINWVYQSEEYQLIGDKKLSLYKVEDQVEGILRYNARRIRRYVPSEMLCSDHHAFPKLVQKRRVVILDSLRQKPVTIKDLICQLLRNEIEANEKTVRFEIISLRQAGFHIVSDGLYYRLEDNIELDVELELFASINEEESYLERVIETLVVEYESTIPSRLVDNLVRYGVDGSKGKEFESVVAEYFKYLGYDTSYLGQGRGRVSDVIARYIDGVYAKSYGIIIDAKATDTKYSFPASDLRKMKEYIETHGIELMEYKIPNHAFAFVSSDFIDDVKRPLEEIYKEKYVPGTAIKVVDLLELGDGMVKGKYKISELYNQFSTNQLFEII